MRAYRIAPRSAGLGVLSCLELLEEWIRSRRARFDDLFASGDSLTMKWSHRTAQGFSPYALTCLHRFVRNQLSRRDRVKVAWHEVPGNIPPAIRPGGTVRCGLAGGTASRLSHTEIDEAFFERGIPI